ncbi:MAG: TFIIB-type zinc ribbon-containing protein [Myxococcales bacterium]
MSKPSDTEEEYFARENAERMRKLAAEQKKALAETERDKLRQLHYMRCPKCGMELKEIGVRGVDVDRCFSCNGTWLDPGELEKLARGHGENTLMAAVLRVFGGGKK